MAVVYIVRTRVEAAYDAEWNRWQEQEHVANLVELPGYRGVQRFADIDRPHTYLNVWRLDDRAAQSTEQYQAASLTPWFDRIRPHYEVSVEFSREFAAAGPDSPALSASGSATWRRHVTGLILDRWTESGVSPAITVREAQSALDERYRAELAAGPGVLQVLRLDRLVENGELAPRSAPSRALLTYVDAQGAADVAKLVPPPMGIERRNYRAVTAYRAAPDRPAPRVGA